MARRSFMRAFWMASAKEEKARAATSSSPAASAVIWGELPRK